MNVLITGGCSGIGAEVGKRLSLCGHKVYLGIHTKSQTKRAIKRLKEYKNIHCIKLDVTKNEDIKQLEDIKIDALFCNAGVGFGGSILEIPIKNLKKNYEVNVISTVKVVQSVIKQMIDRGGGRIIIMSSLLGEVPLKFFGAYSSTKASLISLAISIRKELRLINKNIKVCLIEPGAYYTGFNQIMIENKFDWMKKESYFNNLNKLRNKELKMFNFIEKKRLNTIVWKIEDAILSNNPKFIYSAPFWQVFLIKFYVFLYKFKIFFK